MAISSTSERFAKMMLEWAKEHEKAGLVQQAVDHVLEKGIKTTDLGGHASTKDVSDAVVGYIANLRK